MAQAFSIKDALNAFWSKKAALDAGKEFPVPSKQQVSKVEKKSSDFPASRWQSRGNPDQKVVSKIPEPPPWMPRQKSPAADRGTVRLRTRRSPSAERAVARLKSRRSSSAERLAARPRRSPSAERRGRPEDRGEKRRTSGPAGTGTVNGFVVVPEAHKVKLCFYFNMPGGCRRGKYCQYIHDEAKCPSTAAELRKVSERRGRVNSLSAERRRRSPSYGGNGGNGRAGRSGGPVVVSPRRSRSRSVRNEILKEVRLKRKQRQRAERSRSSSSSCSSSSSSASSEGGPRGASAVKKGSRSRSPIHRSAGGPLLALEAPSNKTEGKADGASRWDMMPSDVTVQENQHLQQLVHQRSRGNRFSSKRSREIYCGNLTPGKVDENRLKLAFSTLFRELPMYRVMYPDVLEPVAHINVHCLGASAYAFIEFVDDVLCSTALMFSGFELCGRYVGIGRPQNYIPNPNGEAKPLDVEPLRKNGLLPPAPAHTISNAKEGKMRELYFGNLTAGRVDPDVIMKLISPVAEKLPEYRPEDGAPVTNVNMGVGGVFCFVQFQSLKLASKIMHIFDGQSLFGKNLKVRRTNAYLNTVQDEPRRSLDLNDIHVHVPIAQGLVALQQPPPPPPRPGHLEERTTLQAPPSATGNQGLSALLGAKQPPPPPPPPGRPHEKAQPQVPFVMPPPPPGPPPGLPALALAPAREPEPHPSQLEAHALAERQLMLQACTAAMAPEGPPAPPLHMRAEDGCEPETAPKMAEATQELGDSAVPAPVLPQESPSAAEPQLPQAQAAEAAAPQRTAPAAPAPAPSLEAPPISEPQLPQAAPLPEPGLVEEPAVANLLAPAAAAPQEPPQVPEEGEQDPE